MSYDFAVEIDTGGTSPCQIEPRFNDVHPAFADGTGGTVLLMPGTYRIGNYTSNVSPLGTRGLSAALGTGARLPLADLAGKPCGAILQHVASAVELGIENIDELRELNPSNGWGSTEGAITYLWDIQRMCEAHPHESVYLSGGSQHNRPPTAGVL